MMIVSTQPAHTATPNLPVLLFQFSETDAEALVNLLLPYGLACLKAPHLDAAQQTLNTQKVSVLMYQYTLPAEQQQKLITLAQMHNIPTIELNESLSTSLTPATLKHQLDTHHIKTHPLPMENFDHDLDLLKITAESILLEGPILLNELTQESSTANSDTQRRLTHTLKSHVRLFNDEETAHFLQTIEDELANGQSLTSNQSQQIGQRIRGFLNWLSLLTQTSPNTL